MNWIYNLCSCITPQFKLSVIDYLNSKELNRQVIQQQKCSESNEPDTADPTDHVYQLAKSRSINFMKLQDKSDDEDDQKQSQLRSEQESEQVIDAFWYPKLKKGQNRVEHYRSMFTHKSKVFAIIMESDPTSKGYDKIYDSQDQINLKVYCKLQSLVRGKKVNTYRFSFKILGINLDDYQKWLGEVKQKDIIPLAGDSITVETDSEDPSLTITQRFYKKLLVISPHEFTTASKTVASNQEQKSIRTIIFSVDEQESKASGKKGEYSKGWLHLCGVEATQQQKGLHLDGYFCVELDVSVSPNMLKQPIAKQIRVVVQKIICSLKKSDEI